MLNSYTITIDTENGIREIFVSPFLLQSKEEPDIQTGEHNIQVLYFYDNLRDDDYWTMLEQGEVFKEEWKSDRFIIDWGQDFEKYYLGSLYIDYEGQCFSQWEGKSGNFSDKDVNTLGKALFNPKSETHAVLMFTPTRPSNINLGIKRTPRKTSPGKLKG
jgi:hypothetical protein